MGNNENIEKTEEMSVQRTLIRYIYRTRLRSCETDTVLMDCGLCQWEEALGLLNWMVSMLIMVMPITQQAHT